MEPSYPFQHANSVIWHEYISSLETQTKGFRVGLQLESFISSDNKQAFVSYLKTHEFDFNSEEYVHFESRMLKLLCFHRAIACATALLNGETGLPAVDIDVGLTPDALLSEVIDHPIPLQIAAKVLCYGLTDLFILHGADPTLDGHECRELASELPLSLALDTLCDHVIVKDFPAGESVDKLFSLFRLQELREPLDTIKLLASRTRQQQVTVIGVCCVETWNLVKLAALLISAWDVLVLKFGDIYSSPITKLIGLQHGVESDLKKKQITSSMLQAIRFVEMSRNFEHEVVPLGVANKLHDTKTLMVSADSDRLAAELLRRNEGEIILTAEAFSSNFCIECIYSLPGGKREKVPHWAANSFYYHLDSAMLLDDRYEFVRVVHGMESFDGLDWDANTDNLPETVRELMFSYDSANCVAAVLAGETDVVLTFRDLTDVGWSFLHKAAKLAAPKLTALLLENGFLADDRRDCDELKIKAALPLNVALEVIRDDSLVRDWKNNKSATDLVALLCSNQFVWCSRSIILCLLVGTFSCRCCIEFDPFHTCDCLCTHTQKFVDRRRILETIRLLVLKTTDVYSEYSRYLKEGKMVELCALLMVANKELMQADFLVHTVIPKSLTHKAGVAGHMRLFSTRTGHGNSYEHNDPLERKGTHVLLDIFGKIGDSLSAYIRLEQIKTDSQITSEVAWLVARAGISDALVSETTNTPSSRMYFADQKRVSEGVNSNKPEQHCHPKVANSGDLGRERPQFEYGRTGSWFVPLNSEPGITGLYYPAASS
ncbi:hypothetical protein KSS87_018427, partial [Heliosperma pusillum]